MKTKLLQRFIQLAAVVFLVWVAVSAISDAKHSEYTKLFLFLMLVPCFLGQWIIPKKFPQLDARQRLFGRLVWLFMSLALFFIILGFADFNASTSEWFVPLITVVLSLLVASHCQHDELSRQLAEKEKIDAVPK